MTTEQAQRIYFSKSGEPTWFQPADLFEWVERHAAMMVCDRIGRNTVDASDIRAQFDVRKYLWGFSPASAAMFIADRYYRYMFQ